MQCSHKAQGHCGKCAGVVVGIGSIKKEHKLEKKVRETYMTITPEDASSIIKSGFRLNSNTYGRILSH